YAINDAKPRWEPTHKDISDADVAMGWFAALDPPELRFGRPVTYFNGYQICLVLRAMDPPLSRAMIGSEIGRSEGRGRQLYDKAVEKITRAANGLPIRWPLKTKDQIAALKDRNKQYAQRERA